MRYYALSSTIKTKAFHADEEWLEANRSKVFPLGCKHLTPRSIFKGITVASVPGSTPLSHISPLSINIAASEVLLAMLGPDGMRAIKIAPVTKCPAKSPTNYLALEPHHSVLVRGQSVSTLKGACETCGHLNYWPGPAREPDRWYLVRMSLKDEAPIYDGIAALLILRKDIYERAKKLNLRTHRMREIPILDEPLDGLPRDLSPAISPEHRRKLGDLLNRDITDYDRHWAERMKNAKDVEKGRIAEWVPPKKY